MTRRILQGGEDTFPGDGAQAQGARGTQFKLNNFFGVPTHFKSDGSSGFFTGTIWVPPSKPMILRAVTIAMGSSVSNSPTNPGNFQCGIFPGPAFATTFALLQIPHTDWVSKGGGGGFTYSAGPQCNQTINGTGPKGTYGDSDAGTNTSQGQLCGETSGTVGPGKVMYWPWSDGINTFTEFDFIVTLTGGDGGGVGTIGSTDFFWQIEGSWL